MVVGADGRYSLVAEAVTPEQYHEKPHFLCGYYSYWSGLPVTAASRSTPDPNAAWPRRPRTTT